MPYGPCLSNESAEGGKEILFWIVELCLDFLMASKKIGQAFGLAFWVCFQMQKSISCWALQSQQDFTCVDLDRVWVFVAREENY